MNRYLENTKKGLLDLNGEKVYELPGAVVRAVDPRKPKANSYGTLYDTTALAKYKPMSLYNYIVFLPSVVRVGDGLFLKKGEGCRKALDRSVIFTLLLLYRLMDALCYKRFSSLYN